MGQKCWNQSCRWILILSSQYIERSNSLFSPSICVFFLHNFRYTGQWSLVLPAGIMTYYSSERAFNMQCDDHLRKLSRRTLQLEMVADWSSIWWTMVSLHKAKLTKTLVNAIITLLYFTVHWSNTSCHRLCSGLRWFDDSYSSCKNTKKLVKPQRNDWKGEICFF